MATGLSICSWLRTLANWIRFMTLLCCFRCLQTDALTTLNGKFPSRQNPIVHTSGLEVASHKWPFDGSLCYLRSVSSLTTFQPTTLRKVKSSPIPYCFASTLATHASRLCHEVLGCLDMVLSCFRGRRPYCRFLEMSANVPTTTWQIFRIGVVALRQTGSRHPPGPPAHMLHAECSNVNQAKFICEWLEHSYCNQPLNSQATAPP